MSQALPLHIALILVPYLEPADIARAQLVCKDWCNVFTSETFLLTALRTHFPFSHEVRSRATSSSPSNTFTRVARRYTALRLGTPQQELRIPITKTRRDAYVWTFAENLLVYQSGHHPYAVLSLLYFDYAASPPRVRRGKVTLGARGETVVRVRVCRDILVVERTDEHVVGHGRTNFVVSAECYRLSFSGDAAVAITRISVIETFEFAYIDYSHQILSDHSGMYYAAYSKSSGQDSGVGVWEIATGKKVKRIAPAMLEGLGGMMTELLVVREGAVQRVVMIGNDKRNNNARRWDRFPSDWGYLSNVRMFTINGDEPDEDLGGFVGRRKTECPRDANLLTMSFKVARLPGGLECADTEDAEEAEEAGLVLWELEDHTDRGTVHYHSLSSAALSAQRDTDTPMEADKEYRVESQSAESGLRPAPFVVRTRDAMSFMMDFTGRNEGFEDTRLMVYHLRIQAFYPSPTNPRVMEMAWESCLKDMGQPDKDVSRSNMYAKEIKRNVFSASRNVSYLNHYGMEVVGDERALAFLELKEGGMDLVIVVWDSPFEGASPEQTLGVPWRS